MNRQQKRWMAVLVAAGLALALFAPRAVAGEWSPANLVGGLDLWLDASDATTIQLRSGLYVTNWLDKSGNNRHVSQADNNKQPTNIVAGLNGKGLVAFDGTDDVVSNSTAALLRNVSGATLVLVSRRTSSVAADGTVLFVGNASNTRGQLNYGTSSQIACGGRTAIGDGYRSIATGAYSSSHAIQIGMLNYGGQSVNLFTNGSFAGFTNLVTAGNTPNDAGGVSIGASLFNGAFCNVEVAEAIICPSVLSLDDRQKLEGYLAWKWGLQGNLPASHPFKDGPPTAGASVPEARQMKITLGGYTNRTEALTNFPVLVMLRPNVGGSSGFDYANFATTTGYDLRFSTDSTPTTNSLNYEIESWNQNGASYVWVQVPTIPGDGTGAIWANWGDSAASNRLACTTNGAVWTNGYGYVSHDGGKTDSTANRNKGTGVGGVTMGGATGFVGPATLFDGTDDAVTLTNSVSISPGTGDLTLEAFVQSSVADSTTRRIFHDYGVNDTHSCTVAMGMGTANKWNGFLRDNTGGYPYQSVSPEAVSVVPSAWCAVVLRKVGKVADLFCNGTLADSKTNSSLGSIDTYDDVQPNIGRLEHPTSGNQAYWKGLIDELRISKVARSTNWVWACYQTMASNTVFNNYGAMTASSGAPSIRNDAVTALTTNSATFNGTLTSTGASACAVGVYWGTDPNAWANTNWFNGGAVDASWINNTPFSTNITGLSQDTTYYYTYAASNAAASVVASGPVPFITGNVWIDKLSDASEIGPVPGTFTVHRASAATNAALVVNYAVGGTAGNGSDYTNLPGTITIPAGMDAVALVVSPAADHFMEGTETVSVTIASGAYPIGASSNATLGIADAGMFSLTWNGAGTNNLASNPSNWVGNAAPVTGDGIVLDATTNKNMTWDLNIAVGAWTQVGYNGTVTVQTVYGTTGFTNLTITGDCVISNGVWTHNGNTTTQANKLDVSVGGSFVLGSNATISVNGRGHKSAEPWGAGTWRNGGSHGGRGGGYGGVSGPCYGSITAPVTLGSDPSPGGAGGAIRLAVSGATTLNGSMSANALPHDADPGQGSGGSVFLTTSNLTGSGSITANGAGNSTYGDKARGGGGRIAVILTGDTNFASVTMTAYAGANNGEKGGAGTIYLRTKDQGPTDGTLIVKGDANSTGWTDINSGVTDASVGDVLIQPSYGKLRITNQTLNVSGVWSNGSSFAASSGGTVRFVGTNTARIYGNSAFDTLLCTNAGKRLEFAVSSSNSVTTALTLTGDATSNLFLRSISDGSQWKINVAAAVNPTLSYLDVQDSDANPGKKLVALNSVGPSQNNLNWDFGSVGQTNTWIGGSNTAWSTAANWDKNRAPIPEDARVIIVSGTYAPILPSAQTFNNLDIQNGASLRLNGFGIVVNESATIAGALIASNTETVVFKGNTDFTGGSFTSATSTVIIGGTNAQAITPAGNTFYTVRVTNTAGVVTFANAFTTTYLRSESASVTYGGNLTATEARLYSTAGTVTQTFNAGSAYAIRDLSVPVSGANGISLRSSSSGTAWLLNVSRSAFVRNATVQDSNAGGILIRAMTSTDVSGNNNWDFGGTWGAWMGGTSTVFTNALNWSPAVAPGASTRVVIDGGYVNAPVIATAVSIRQLVLGLEQASALTANAALTVVEDVNVGGYGTLTLNQPSVVSNNVTVLTGGTVTHTANASSEANKLNLRVVGNLVLDQGAAITANNRGYAANQGFGKPVSAAAYESTAASHGGRGGAHGGGIAGPTYGSVLSPTNCGSGATVAGGGVVLLTVGGTATVNGTISANSASVINGSGGAGGSVWLTAGVLAGSGAIEAKGGPTAAGGATDKGDGGGGRLAVILTGSESFGSVTLSAAAVDGVGVNGGAGTIYRQTPSQGAGKGVVTIDNNMTASGTTPIPPMTNAVLDELRYASVIVTNRGAIALTTNDQIQSLTVVSVNELLNLGTSNTVLTVKALSVNGTVYTRSGLYTTNNWNDYTPVPVNVSGAGAISLIGMKGTVFRFR